MLPGKFISVIPDYENVEGLLSKVYEGYLKASWRDNEELKTGYILVSNHEIVGLIVEHHSDNKVFQGREALDEILTASRHRKVTAVEIYEYPVNSIFRDYPKARFKLHTPPDQIPGENLEEILQLLKSYHGELIVHNSEISWSLQIEEGRVKAAKTIRGPPLKGDVAMDHLLKEMGEIIKSGKYEIGKNIVFSHSAIVKREGSFKEILELLNEKQKIEQKKL